jgi:GNAT superfamily N-acetyltransferase
VGLVRVQCARGRRTKRGSRRGLIADALCDSTRGEASGFRPQSPQRRSAEFNRQHAGDDGYRPLAFFLRDPDGAVVGGIYGIAFWGCLSVKMLWVEQRLRGRGYGERLLAAAEQEAIRRGCSHAFLDTLDFQAPSFYMRQGYEIFGKLANLPSGHTRYYLAKWLQRTSETDA